MRTRVSPSASTPPESSSAEPPRSTTGPMRVPFVEPGSVTTMRPRRIATSAWKRDTVGSVSTSPFVVAVPSESAPSGELLDATDVGPVDHLEVERVHGGARAGPRLRCGRRRRSWARLTARRHRTDSRVTSPERIVTVARRVVTVDPPQLEHV
jgi:hypothetical protein